MATKMKSDGPDQYLFVEKYRPQTVSDCILPSTVKDRLDLLVTEGSGHELGHMLFTGTAGVGKTTVAKALCNQLGLDMLMINASEDGNIDTLRTKIRQFASTVSLQDSGYKVVIMDECDYMTSAAQPAMRGLIEEFSDNCRFILTCNFKNRIIGPIQSRCSEFDFTIPPKEKPKIAAMFFKRLIHILKTEGIEYEKAALAQLIESYFPDWRKVLNTAQSYGMCGKIDTGVLVNLDGDKIYDDLFEHLKNKDYTKMRKWVSENADIEARRIFRAIYDKIGSKADPKSIPGIVVTLAQYQYWDAFVADSELNTVACLTEIMASSDWR